MTPPLPLRPHESADLVEEHLSLVEEALRRVCRRLPAHVDRDDLVGAGRVALVQAARQYDPQRGAFAPFAARRLTGAMLDELRRNDWATRSVRSVGRQHAAAVEELSSRLGRTPTREEIAEVAGRSSDELRRYEAEAHRAVITSLEALLEWGDDPARDHTSPGDAMLLGERDAHLHGAIAALPARVRHAVTARYLDERPIREIARELGVSESRVSQLCTEGLAGLRRTLGAYLHDERVPA